MNICKWKNNGETSQWFWPTKSRISRFNHKQKKSFKCIREAELNHLVHGWRHRLKNIHDFVSFEIPLFWWRWSFRQMFPCFEGLEEDDTLIKKGELRSKDGEFYIQRLLNSQAVSVTKLGDFFTLGNHSKPVATIILPKLPTLLNNFCKVVKIIHFSCEIIFGQLLYTFGNFYLVTLQAV